MGLFDTYIIPCPHCGESVYDQKKPGYMNTYVFGDNPIDDLEFAGFYHCYFCKKDFTVEMESVPKMIIKKVEE
jgi:hypothetical protein